MNTINATVLQKNLTQFVSGPCAGSYGQTLPIPAGSQAAPQAEFWAVPIKNNGYFQGFEYTIYQSGVAAPTIDSIRCFKLVNTLNDDYFYVAGTVAQFSVYAAACCDASPIPSYITTLGPIAGCLDTCTSDGTNYDAFFAVQTLSEIAGGRYAATVLIDGVGVLQQTYAAGSTSLANLVTYLNAHAAGGTWSNPNGNTIRFRTTSLKNVCFNACILTS